MIFYKYQFEICENRQLILFSKHQLRKVDTPYKKGSIKILSYKLKFTIKSMNRAKNLSRSRTNFYRFIDKIYDLIVSIFGPIQMIKRLKITIVMVFLVLLKLRRDSKALR
jgi:hypothetical protein